MYSTLPDVGQAPIGHVMLTQFSNTSINMLLSWLLGLSLWAGWWNLKSYQIHDLITILNKEVFLANLCRCLGFCFPRWNGVLLRRWCYHLVACIWIYATIMVVPTICGWYGQFGYDMELGKCDYIRINEDSEKMHPRTLFLGISFLLPLFLIIMSYTIIWRKAKSRCFLRQSS